MGTYYIPRNVKGETRLFKIFSVKALIYTICCGIIGLIFNVLISSLGVKYVGMAVMGIFALIGFVVGTLKVPNIFIAPIFRICAGENIDEILLRAIKFRMNKKIYIYGKSAKKLNRAQQAEKTAAEAAK